MPCEAQELVKPSANVASDQTSSTALTKAFARQLAEYLEFGGDPVRVGNDIQKFADQHGDDAVSAVVDELSDIDLSNVLRQFDLTFTSPIQQAVTPERFAVLVEMEHKYAAGDYAELRGMLSGVLFAESDESPDDHVIECLNAIALRPHAVDLISGMLAKHAERGVLQFWFSGDFHGDTESGYDQWLNQWLDDCQKGAAEPMNVDDLRSLAAPCTRSIDAGAGSDMADGDLQQLCWVLREYHEELFLDVVLQILRDMARRHIENGGA